MLHSSLGLMGFLLGMVSAFSCAVSSAATEPGDTPCPAAITKDAVNLRRAPSLHALRANAHPKNGVQLVVQRVPGSEWLEILKPTALKGLYVRQDMVNLQECTLGIQPNP